MIKGFIQVVVTSTFVFVIYSAIAQTAPIVEADGTVLVPAFNLPESKYLSDKTRAILKSAREYDFVKEEPEVWEEYKACGLLESADIEAMPKVRQCLAEAHYKTAGYRHLRALYDVNITPKIIGGVYTEVFTPTNGVARKNARRVLINVHGGSFRDGSRTESHTESIPIASIGQIKVISIDYRMAPEHRFPAASEDVAAVYKALLNDYHPDSIGLYGCSAGAFLVAHAIAWFLNEGLPLPAATGMFCAGALTVLDEDNFKLRYADGFNIAGTIVGLRQEVAKRKPRVTYFDGVKRDNPLAAPGGYDEVMAQFPPSLLISGTRDFDLSETVNTHRQLTRLGVEADLQIWEGMEHFFFRNPDLPESGEAYDVIVKFFDKHLK